MKLYVCYGTWKRAPRSEGLHPCGRAYNALRDAGYDPEVVKTYGLGAAPDAVFNRTSGRQEVKRLTGSTMVPVLVTDDGEVIQDSKNIVAWAKQNPASRETSPT